MRGGRQTNSFACRADQQRQYSRSMVPSKSDHLLTGLLFDDAGHRMIPTHATKAGIRYRYYASLPHLKGESKTASVGSVSRIRATDIEDIIVKSLNEHLVARHDQPSSISARADDRGMIAEHVARIDVHKDRLMVRFKSAGTEEGSHSTDGVLLSIACRNRRPGNPDRSSSRAASLKTQFVRPALSDARASLARSPEAVIGLTRSSQIRPLTSSRSPHAKNAACDRSI
jgi:site-specific DNA recombinase